MIITYTIILLTHEYECTNNVFHIILTYREITMRKGMSLDRDMILSYQMIAEVAQFKEGHKETLEILRCASD